MLRAVTFRHEQRGRTGEGADLRPLQAHFWRHPDNRPGETVAGAPELCPGRPMVRSACSPSGGRAIDRRWVISMSVTMDSAVATHRSPTNSA